jgi:lysophospholipase L1-like esterase
MSASYLALGDSYTIGEQVGLHESFPYQAVQLLRGRGVAFTAPEIIAKTGWTTGELAQIVKATRLLQRYDAVSLLIGVNNQYRGIPVADFKKDFTQLVKDAIGFAGNSAAHVFVFSIPDWGITPYAVSKDQKKIREEIDAYNAVCSAVARDNDVHFIEITASQRADAADETFIAIDGLHPSGKEYAKWAALLADAILTVYR